MGNEEAIFSPNKAIDVAIKRMLLNFDPASQRRMKKAILSAKKSAEKHRDENTDASARHIFREFIPASILNQHGFAFEYEKSIDGKTPDWLDNKENIILECYTFERGGSSNFIDRTIFSITEKCNKYKNIAIENSFRFVVAVYLDFLSGVSLEECHKNSKIFQAIFEANDSLWAILFFTETQALAGKQQYGFFCLGKESSTFTIPNWPFQLLETSLFMI